MNLDNLKTKSGIKLDQDRVGGFRLLETDVYDLDIKLAYLSEAKSGAVALNLQAETPQGARVNQAIYMTSGTAKGGTNTYKDKEGHEQYLPGFVLANSLSLLSVGDEIVNLDREEKVVNIYNFKEKKEVPTKVNMVMPLIGATIKAGIEKQIVDKNTQNDEGKWVSTGETREQNEIVKFFRSRDNMTVTEIEAQVEEATYIDTWIATHKGQVNDKSKGNAGVKSGAPVKAGTPSKATAPGVASLFS